MEEYVKQLLAKLKLTPIKLALYITFFNWALHPYALYHAIKQLAQLDFTIITVLVPVLFYLLLAWWTNNIGAVLGAYLLSYLLCGYCFRMFWGIPHINAFLSWPRFIINMVLHADAVSYSGIFAILRMALMALGGYLGMLAWKTFKLPANYEDLATSQTAPTSYGPTTLLRRLIYLGYGLQIALMIWMFPIGITVFIFPLILCGICHMISKKAANKWPIFGGVAALLIIEIWGIASVLASKASTAALGVLALPLFTILALPIGLIIGWLLGVVIRWTRDPAGA